MTDDDPTRASAPTSAVSPPPSAAATDTADLSTWDSGQLAKALMEALEQGDDAALARINEALHAADIADLFEQITGEDRRRLIGALGDRLDPDVLTELDKPVLEAVRAQLTPEQLADAVKSLDTDDKVYVLEDLEPETQDAVLQALDAGERVVVEQSLSYPEYSAGRLMQREMVYVSADWTVGRIIDWMRDENTTLPEQFYDILVVDESFKPIGTAPLSRVLANKRPVRIDALMTRDFRSFLVDQSQEEVGYAFNQYHLVSAPVIDAGGRLVGVITIDDAMQALDEETEEDLLRLGGVGDESLGDAVAKIAKRRFPWLAVNLATAVLASLVIGLFDAAIDDMVALAILMPIVASMGGNAGTQTMTVAVRALATKDLTRTNALRVIAREALVGLSNGLAFAVVVGIVGVIWFGELALGGVLALAMIITMLAAGLSGILIPLGLQRVGADPALSSGVFVTTATDVVGFFAFLGIAVLLLF